MADQKITQLTADTTPTTDDLIVTVNDPAGTPGNKKVTLSDLTKALGGAWVSYSPTITQVGTVTYTATQSAYNLIGKTCTYRYYLSITGTGTAGTNFTISLPLTSITGNYFGGFIGWYDSSAAQTYAGGHTFASTTTFSGIKGGATTPGAYFGTDPNAGLGNGDVVAGTIIYEIA